MIFDEVFHALSRCLAGLAQPFQVPGTDQLFRPKIFVTILAYSSIIGLASHQVWSVWVDLRPNKHTLCNSFTHGSYPNNHMHDQTLLVQWCHVFCQNYYYYYHYCQKQPWTAEEWTLRLILVLFNLFLTHPGFVAGGIILLQNASHQGNDRVNMACNCFL